MRCEFDCVLHLRMGPVDREFDARIIYQGGRLQADIERFDVRDGEHWISVPALCDLVEDCPALFDALRQHAVGRALYEREQAADLRR